MNELLRTTAGLARAQLVLHARVNALHAALTEYGGDVVAKHQEPTVLERAAEIEAWLLRSDPSARGGSAEQA